jgi:hypothetical protein
MLEGTSRFTCLSNCGVSKSVPQGQRVPVSFTFSGSTLTSISNSQSQVTLNGTLGGSASNAWLLLSDLPKTTTGTLSISQGSNAATSPIVDLASLTAANPQGGRTATIRLSNGGLFSVSVPATGPLTGTYQTTSGFEFCFSNCNIGFSTSTDLETLTFQNSAFGAFAFNGTVGIGRTSGTLSTSSSALSSFTPTSDRIQSENDLRTMTFEIPNSFPSTGLTRATVLHRNRVVKQMTISGFNNNSAVSYTCNVDSTNTSVVPLCTGITVDANQRTVTVSQTSLRDMASGTSITTSGTLVSKGL